MLIPICNRDFRKKSGQEMILSAVKAHYFIICYMLAVSVLCIEVSTAERSISYSSHST